MSGKLAVLCAMSLVSAAEVMGADKPAPQPIPPGEVRAKGGEYGPEKWKWEGVAVVGDPVNKETLHLGGRCGGAVSRRGAADRVPWGWLLRLSAWGLSGTIVPGRNPEPVALTGHNDFPQYGLAVAAGPTE